MNDYKKLGDIVLSPLEQIGLGRLLQSYITEADRNREATQAGAQQTIESQTSVALAGIAAKMAELDGVTSFANFQAQAAWEVFARGEGFYLLSDVREGFCPDDPDEWWQDVWVQAYNKQLDVMREEGKLTRHAE